jgi:hypothetical protein
MVYYSCLYYLVSFFGLSYTFICFLSRDLAAFRSQMPRWAALKPPVMIITRIGMVSRSTRHVSWCLPQFGLDSVPD